VRRRERTPRRLSIVWRDGRPTPRFERLQTPRENAIMRDARLTRRELLRLAGTAAAAAALPKQLRAHPTAGARPSTHAIESAIRAADWIRASRVASPGGIAWPADPLQPDSVTRSLYTGTPGVVLFHLELHHATGEARFLEEAVRGARDLAASLPDMADDSADAGLYTGVAGVAFVLAETARATGDGEQRAAALRATQWLLRHARRGEHGVSWSESADIISGSAGIALQLLSAARALNVDGATETALDAARHLAALGIPANGGLKWRISERVANLYPNFSHGTAGVAYTLATVAQETGERTLVDAALAGATYLDAVTDRTAGCKVFHHEPGGEQLYYLSWCHGPAGTARLHERLHRSSSDATWRERVACGGHATLAMGAPETRSDGYWNNISQCCGTAGVGEFFLALHAVSRDPEHLAVAQRAAHDVLGRATEEGTGLKWTQSEHRVRPELLVAQTGLMQGAAGVGMFLLRLDAAERGKESFVRMPDTPFS
jgi:lantibiotic modifying enzyme